MSVYLDGKKQIFVNREVTWFFGSWPCGIDSANQEAQNLLATARKIIVQYDLLSALSYYGKSVGAHSTFATIPNRVLDLNELKADPTTTNQKIENKFDRSYFTSGLLSDVMGITLETRFRLVHEESLAVPEVYRLEIDGNLTACTLLYRMGYPEGHHSWIVYFPTLTGKPNLSEWLTPEEYEYNRPLNYEIQAAFRKHLYLKWLRLHPLYQSVFVTDHTKDYLRTKPLSPEGLAVLERIWLAKRKGDVRKSTRIYEFLEVANELEQLKQAPELVNLTRFLLV